MFDDLLEELRMSFYIDRLINQVKMTNKYLKEIMGYTNYIENENTAKSVMNFFRDINDKLRRENDLMNFIQMG